MACSNNCLPLYFMPQAETPISDTLLRRTALLIPTFLFRCSVFRCWYSYYSGTGSGLWHSRCRRSGSGLPVLVLVFWYRFWSVAVLLPASGSGILTGYSLFSWQSAFPLCSGGPNLVFSLDISSNNYLRYGQASYRSYIPIRVDL